MLRLTTIVKMIEGAVTGVTCHHELLSADAKRVRARARAAGHLVSTAAPLLSGERPVRATRRGRKRGVGLDELPRRSA